MQNSVNRVNMLQLCAKDIAANADKLLADVPYTIPLPNTLERYLSLTILQVTLDKVYEAADVLSL